MTPPSLLALASRIALLLLMAGCAAPEERTLAVGRPLPAMTLVSAPLALPLAPAPTPAPAPAPAPAPFSARLKNQAVASPMPGGFLGGWGGDTGLDIAGDHLPVFALAAGTLDYSEWGHTRWMTGKDTAFSIRIALDEPIPWGERGERRITHVYYTHLSKVDTNQREGSENRKHVVTGEHIAISGIGNGTPHLHLGLLLDGRVEQDSWTYILREHEVRKALGNYKNGSCLP